MNVLRWHGWALALPLIAAAQPMAAHAVGPCFPREALIAHLAERYGERPVATGIAGDRLVLLLSGRDGASWTILLVPPDPGGSAIACPLAAGEGWRTLVAPDPEAPAPPESSS
jgi:hypothetical protein